MQRAYVRFPFECHLHIAVKAVVSSIDLRILQVLGHRITRRPMCAISGDAGRNWPRALLNALKVRAFKMAKISKSLPFRYLTCKRFRPMNDRWMLTVMRDPPFKWNFFEIRPCPLAFYVWRLDQWLRGSLYLTQDFHASFASRTLRLNVQR